MNLPVTQSIFHGALRPGLSPDIPFQALSRMFGNPPDNLPEIEALFISGLSKYVTLHFEKPVSVSSIAPDAYTPIIEYTLQPVIDFRYTEAQQTPQLLFYKTIIHAEAIRIKLALRHFAGIAQSDTDTRQEVKETLRLIKSYIKNSPRCTDDIFPAIQTQLTKLYYELTLAFDELLTENDFIPVDDLFLECYNRYPTSGETDAYQAARLIRQTQKCIARDIDTGHAQTLLPELYRLAHDCPRNTQLTATAAALENYIYLKWNHQGIPGFDPLIDSDFVNLYIEEQKSVLKQQYEREEIALDRANIIDDILAALPFTSLLQHPLSITHHLSSFLNRQKEQYLKDPGALFKVVVKKQPGELKNKPQPTIKPMQIKTKLAIVRKYLAFLNGVNPKDGRRIMSESDYALLVSYVEHLVKHGTIPEITRKIPKSNIGKTWFRYTLYLIHNELYASTQDIWIDFMQVAFDVFSPEIIEFPTLKTKFSTPPSGYTKFVEQVLGPDKDI